mgnify:CR=1 FL=1
MSNQGPTILSFVPGQARAGIRVFVTTADELSMQTYSLLDVVRECHHAVTELLATMISVSNNVKGVDISTYGAQGAQLVRDIFVAREPQVNDTLCVEFSAEETEDKAHLDLKFRCAFQPVLAATIYSNDAAVTRVH